MTVNRKVIDIQNTAECKINYTQNAVSFKAQNHAKRKTPLPVFSRLKAFFWKRRIAFPNGNLSKF